MGLVCNPASRRCDAQRFIQGLHNSDSDTSEGMAGRSGLADYATSRWHLFAAVLTVMTMPHALHRFAALHCLLRRRHRSTVERIAGESNREHRGKD